MTHEVISLTDAAIRTGMTWGAAYSAMTSGKFGTPQKDGRKWVVPVAGVEEYLRRTTLRPSAS